MIQSMDICIGILATHHALRLALRIHGRGAYRRMVNHMIRSVQNGTVAL